MHTYLRDDAIHLYGFLTLEEKEAFTLLIGVSGIGPRLARNILSGISVNDLVSAISSSDKSRLSAIPGIGTKTAERLMLELRDRIKNFNKAEEASGPGSGKDLLMADVVSALDNLGYKNSQSSEAVKKARKILAEECAFEDLFKEALRLLSKRQS